MSYQTSPNAAIWEKKHVSSFPRLFLGGPLIFLNEATSLWFSYLLRASYKEKFWVLVRTNHDYVICNQHT